MAIEFDLMLEKKAINEEMLLEELRNIGQKDPVGYTNENGVFICESCCESLGFIVYLNKNKKPPYNVWDSELLKDEFPYAQSLSFWFDTSRELSSGYENAMKIIFALMRNASDTKALLEMSGGYELCFFNGEGKLLLNRKRTVWNNIDIQEELSHWEVIDVMVD